MFGQKKGYKNRRPDRRIFNNTRVQNAASNLLANIRFSSVDKEIKTISVSSSVPNEGKTTIVIALAIAMGASGKSCVILECDMRRRSLTKALSARPKHGIHAVMVGECDLDSAVIETDYENVYLLDAEAGIPKPDSILNAQTFTDLLEALSSKYDYVLIDTPPATAFADAAIVASKVDAAILVVKEGLARKPDLLSVKNQFDAGNANVIGVVINSKRSSQGKYGYSHYYEND